MQKNITVRSSQGNLANKLMTYLNDDWKVVSTARGSEQGRILNTYSWTVVLEKDDVVASNSKSTSSATDELLKARRLLDSRAITQEEYQKLKDKILK